MKKWFSNLEFGIVGIVIVAMVMRNMDIGFADTFLMIGLLALTFSYFYFGISASFSAQSSISPYPIATEFSNIEKTVLLATGNAISISVIGLLFYIMKWEGAEFMLMVGTIANLITIVVVYFMFRLNHAAVFNFIFYRQLPIALMCGLMWYYADKINF